ncbi:hypothetical protein C4D60_Mb09t14080 [Musa balbisiana]|uniref:Uncharacterized protein n=1 Tax=Musa balbisiana TaxID=52838 RepID=A0A4S8IGD8_MUSBA|nr:hypothetical protein C4D60_Mb09t14080 [Musa balbisiana]
MVGPPCIIECYSIFNSLCEPHIIIIIIVIINLCRVLVVGYVSAWEQHVTRGDALGRLLVAP